MEYPQKMKRYCKPCESDTSHIFSGVQPVHNEVIEYSDGPRLIRTFRINYDCMLCKSRTFDADRASAAISKLEASLIAAAAAEAAANEKLLKQGKDGNQ